MTATSTTPNYCPFCGARLRDDVEGYGTHFARHEDCRERAEAWVRQERGPSSRWNAGGDEVPFGGRGRAIVASTLAISILASAIIVVGQLLLGILAAGFVLVAFYVWGAIG